MKVKILHNRMLGLLLASLLPPPSGADPVTAITADTNLPAGHRTLVPAAPVGGIYEITGGLARSGGGNTNLFHSFAEFSINSAHTARFSAPGVNNIVSRVTGGVASDIWGRIEAPGNLYLVNPAGVIFGPTASIDVGGAFHTSTADYVVFEDDIRFSATSPEADDFLTFAPPAAFGFIADPLPSTGFKADIQVGDTLLQARQSQLINLVGGGVQVTDGHLYAPDGQVAITSVASAGEVPVDPAMVNTGDFASLGDIRVANPSGTFPFLGLGLVGNLDVTTLTPQDGVGGGRILLRGGNFYLDGGLVRAEVLENVDGGGIEVKLADQIKMTGDSKLLSRTFVFSGDAGDLGVEAGSLVMQDTATISSGSGGAGNGGVVSIRTGTTSMSGSTFISADTTSLGSGGSVQMTTGTLDMSGIAVMKTSTFSGGAFGDAGSVTVQADTISMSGEATINSSTELGSSGQAGQVNVQAGNLSMSGDAWIISYTETAGNAGQITIDTGDMNMADQSVVSTSTFSAGNGGTILLTTGKLTLDDAAIITSGTEGSGAAGDVIINSRELRVMHAANISSESEGGNFFVRGGPDLSTAAGGGEGGNIRITSPIVMLLYGGSTTTETSNADGGNITIVAGNTVALKEGAISTSVAGGLGNGGNVNIDASILVILNNSSIIANAFGGDGGNIQITTNELNNPDGSVIEASSAFGLDGSVDIQTGDQDVSTEAIELPESFLAVLELASQQCALRTRSDISSLVISGRDGLPPSPDDLLPATPAGNAGKAGIRTHALAPEGIPGGLAVICAG